MSHLNEFAKEGLIIFIVPSIITITEKGIGVIEALTLSSSSHQFAISKEVA